MKLNRNLLRLGLVLLALSGAIVSAWSQTNSDSTSVPGSAGSSKDGLRILFDSRGGFKLYHLDANDGTYQTLLNPAVENPVSLELWRNGSSLPIKVVEGTPSTQEGDPGYRGPAFTADDINIQLWGLDLSSTDTSWSAIRYEFTNTGSSITTLSLRFIFDTFLGESGREPLAILDIPSATKRTISDETQQKVDDQPRIIASVKSDSSESLYLLLPAKNWPHQVPQRMIAANIRRLQNSGSVYEVEEHRAFNLLPFSINDSAIALVHDSEVLLPRQRIAIDILVSPILEIDAARLDKVKSKLDNIKVTRVGESGIAPAASQDPQSENRTQLMQRINRMIDQLNSMMISQSYKQGEVEKLLQAIDTAQKQLEAKP